nr:hypothetical protein [Candidatus Enterousia merdequi]
MNFFQKLGKVLGSNMTLTIIFAVAIIFFLYFAGGDIIGGLFTALSALVAYIAATLLYGKFKNMPVAKPAPKKVKTVAKKKK